MPIPNSINDLSPTPASNFPAGSDSPEVIDNVLREHAAYIAQIRDGYVSLAADTGSALVGFKQAGTGAVARTSESKLREFVSVKDFGAIGDGVTDDTAAVQAAVTAAAGKKLWFPYGTYIIDSVSVRSSVDIVCDVGVVFKRKANSDAASGSYWNVGAAMFEVDAAGLTVRFTGSYTYDGNNTNQTTTEPTGFFLKTYPPSLITGEPTVISLGHGEFKNGTSGYLLLRGDDVNRRYETLVDIANCRFYDTVKGKGKGDPSTPNPLGYLPTYVLVMDYVRLNTLNFHAEWNTPLTTGEYAACALNGTFFGAVYANSGESYINMHGTTYLNGVGRSGKKWDNDSDYLTNNGIGAIDCYGNADTLFIECLVGVDCQNVVARAKGSLKNYSILNAVLTNCHRGLQVSASTTGPCETIVNVGSVNCYGGTIPQVEFFGTNASDVLPSVTVGAVHASGAFTNPEALSSVDTGVVRLRNVGRASVKSAGIYSSPTVGISANAITRVDLGAVIINSTTKQGIAVNACGNFTLNNFDIRNTGDAAVNIFTSIIKASIRGGYINTAVNYGVFGNVTSGHITVDSVDVDSVSGTARGFYSAGAALDVTHNKTTSVTNPLVYAAGTIVNDVGNSWNANIRYGAVALTTIGTARVGDIVYNIAPVAAGNIGWVCTTAGTPGTWKTFGAIAA